MYYGDIRLGETLDVKFTSRSFTTGAPTTLSGTPVISAYVGNGTTEITAGITLSVDFDSRTGLNNIRVVASGANGFATATNVVLVITTGTVGGVSVVGECVGSFSIECRSALMPTTAARTLDVTATGGGGIDWGNVENPTTSLNLSGTTTNLVNTATTTTTATNVTTVNGLAAGVITATSIAADAITAAKIADNAIDTATFAAGTTIPRVTLADTVTTYTGNIPQTGDSFALIGATGSGLTSLAPSATALSTATWTGTLATNLGTTNTTVAANLDAAVSSRMATYTQPTGFLTTVFGATVGTSTLTQTQVTGGAYTIQSASCVLGDARIANLDAAVSSRMATYVQPTGFLAATFPTDPADQSLVIAATDAILTAVGTKSSQTSVDDLPTNAEFTARTLATADYATAANLATVLGVTNKLDTTVVLDGAVYQFTANALELAPTGGSAPTVSQIATAVWQDATAGDFTTAGSIGKSLFTSGNVPGAASGLALVGSNVGVATSVSGAVGSVTGNVGGNVVGSVASVTAPVVLTGDYDAAKTAAQAATALSTATWTGALATNLGTSNATIATNLNATVSSRASQVSVDDVPTNAEFAAALALVSTSAQLVKVLAAVYDTATGSGGNVLTLSNGGVQTINLSTGTRTTVG